MELAPQEWQASLKSAAPQAGQTAEDKLLDRAPQEWQLPWKLEVPHVGQVESGIFSIFVCLRGGEQLKKYVSKKTLRRIRVGSHRCMFSCLRRSRGCSEGDWSEDYIRRRVPVNLLIRKTFIQFTIHSRFLLNILQSPRQHEWITASPVNARKAIQTLSWNHSWDTLRESSK